VGSWLVAALLLLAAPAAGTTIVLDFEEETPGVVEDGRISVECDCVAFRAEPDHEDLVIGNGRLANLDESSTGITLDLLTPATALSLDFFDSTDDDRPGTPAFTQAVLQAFLGMNLVGEASVIADGNSALDQTITISGVGQFDRVFFSFYAEAGPLWTGEVIDNVTVEIVPEPTVLAFGAAAALLAWLERR
jgi:hypothetical protein